MPISSSNSDEFEVTGRLVGLGCAVIAAGVAAIVGGLSLLNAVDSTDAGSVGVVRNGGWLSNKNIRQVMPPGSGQTWVGLWTSTHKYPAQQRFYTITSRANAGDRPGVDVVNTPSSDGVDMGIEGTVYFQLNLDPKTLRQFDDKFGTRTFTTSDGKTFHAYDGDAGWSAFLDQVIRPVLDNDLRQQVAGFKCAELVSSCALVQNTSQGQPQTAAAVGQANNGNIAAVQNAINTSLAQDLTSTLGGQYLTGLRFNLVRVTLPANVQDAVNKAQAAYAAVSESQAKVAQAKADADANAERERGYQNCPACAEIDTLKAIPPNVTTFAPGAGFAITPGK